MPAHKEDEIMAEHLLKGGKMLEKTCKTCGCPLFEVKGKTLCVVCAENEQASDTKNPKGIKKAAVPAGQGVPASQIPDDGNTCTCGEDHSEESCTCGNTGGMLADELAMTILSLCGRVPNEKDPENVLTLMNSVKAGCEALEILCRL
jgi:UPF0148 protein